MSYKTVSSKTSLALIPASPVASLVWMHGLGDTCQGFKDFFELPASPLHRQVKVKILQAPIRPVTINQGKRMPSWYDILTLQAERGKDEVNYAEVYDSCEIIARELESERGLPLFLGGFSQGCVMALQYALEREQVRGVAGLSGYCLQRTELKHPDTPILLQHGTQDEMIPLPAAKLSYERLAPLKDCKFTERAGLGHWVDEKELEAISEFIARLL